MTDLAPAVDAPQHEPVPRPLPLFLALVQSAGERDPDLARAALAGLRAYGRADRSLQPAPRPVVASVGGASLRDCGGAATRGTTVVLVPSLINPPHILDLDPDCSLAAALARKHHVLLLDWGPAAARPLSLSDHVETLLVPLLQQLEVRPVLVGYCLGGTLALAAASRVMTGGVATLAAPWAFDRYPPQALAALQKLRDDAWPAAQSLGAMPMEVLQSAFWSLDPLRIVGKFARFAELDPASAEARRFVALEDWANAGEAVPLAAATELVDALFTANASGRDDWFGLPDAPLLHFTAANDRIVPAATAAPGRHLAVPAGHVGMIVGRQAAAQLQRPLLDWLDRL